MKQVEMGLEEAIRHLRAGKTLECRGVLYKFGCDHYHIQGLDGLWRPRHVIPSHGWLFPEEVKEAPATDTMLLEDALIAMRDGRLAIWGGYKYRIDNNGKLLRLTRTNGWDSWTSFRSEDLRDFAHGWSLVPLPPVKWPEGSIQWAYGQIAIRGQKIRRKGMVWTTSSRTGDSHSLGYEDLTALDWEVVE